MPNYRLDTLRADPRTFHPGGRAAPAAGRRGRRRQQCPRALTTTSASRKSRSATRNLLDATSGEIDTVPLPWGGQLAAAFLWAVGGVAGAALLGLAAWLAWRRYMTPSEDPRVAFRRMATLGTLASVGPASHQTPFQYRLRLSNLLPDHRQPVAVIIDYYVRSTYGRKELDDAQRQELAQAWLDLRMPLLLRILRPRNI